MKTKSEELQEYLESLGWVYYEKHDFSPKIKGFIMGDSDFGKSWFTVNIEIGFNTGSDFYLAFDFRSEVYEHVLISVFEQRYNSYGGGEFFNQYRLDGFKELPLLMKFKGIV